MIISIIVAMDEQRGIGFQNRLPWHLAADLKRFKSLTLEHYILMGRKTYESIGRLLPGRTMVVLTRKKDFHPKGCLVRNSLQEGLNLAESDEESEVFVIGGGDVFAQVLPVASRIYLTQVHTRAQCDVFFPKVNREDWWETDISHHEADDLNQYPYSFITLLKKAAL
jgi:dihydrofolate reductase